jgi:3-methyl-2-oxobutanoate hydroxymethyltransferase
LLTSFIGAGSGGDIQFPFAEDILGNHRPPYPSHSKQYRNLPKMREAMQAERIAGFSAFLQDVRSGGSPVPSIIEAPDRLISAFVDHAETNNT